MKFSYTTAIITDIHEESPRIKTFTLDVALSAKPGQYVMLWMPDVNEKPFGIVTTNPLRLSIAKVGSFTEKVHELKVGDKMTFRGPCGSSFVIHGRHPLLVGGGYGVVPLYLLVQSFALSVRKQTTVIIGAKTNKDLIFVSKFKALGCNDTLTSTDDGSAGFHGLSTDLARRIMTKQSIDHVYACGPEPMMKKIVLMAKENRLPSQVSLERQFKCGGMGLCGSCSFMGKLVCVDGPVFSGEILLGSTP